MFIDGNKPDVRLNKHISARAMTCIFVGISMVLAAGLKAHNFVTHLSIRKTSQVVSNADIKDNPPVLDNPDEFIGKELPLLKYIDAGSQIAHGRWVVIIYENQCGMCAYEIPRFERLAKKLDSSHSSTHVAIIELPPYGGSEADDLGKSAPDCLKGRLSPSSHWRIRTPTTFVINDSVVECGVQGVSY